MFSHLVETSNKQPKEGRIRSTLSSTVCILGRHFVMHSIEKMSPGPHKITQGQ